MDWNCILVVVWEGEESLWRWKMCLVLLITLESLLIEKLMMTERREDGALLIHFGEASMNRVNLSKTSA